MASDLPAAPLPRARKRFGQHFLHDPAIVRRIVNCVAVDQGETVVEIGPGRGALTGLLASCGVQLHLVEIDRELAGDLTMRYAETPAVTVHTGDALRFDFTTLAGQLNTRLVLVGNLPYNIASPLLIGLLSVLDCVDRAIFMLQREVAQRLAAMPGSRDYGRLTVMMSRLCRVELLFDVRPGAFQPPPKVDSTLVRVCPRAAPLGPPVDSQAYAQVVRTAFSQRRKTLRNSLRSYHPDLAFEEAGIDPGTRPETLSAAQFAQLTAALYPG
ncbi:MAG: 16S rRNA (adenine(1518)-N(6)/adenine(1519)-N(6))-dimethyltransferase RsmA [Pseudomonadota bacterium]|nr:16S rRNA (adenine(1518)-N(6)/adenine(1519)-N(6))-dimethyltransferase RsmA [Pseudomonadota bacterium]